MRPHELYGVVYAVHGPMGMSLMVRPHAARGGDPISSALDPPRAHHYVVLKCTRHSTRRALSPQPCIPSPASTSSPGSAFVILGHCFLTAEKKKEQMCATPPGHLIILGVVMHSHCRV